MTVSPAKQPDPSARHTMLLCTMRRIVFARKKNIYFYSIYDVFALNSEFISCNIDRCRGAKAVEKEE